MHPWAQHAHLLNRLIQRKAISRQVKFRHYNAVIKTQYSVCKSGFQMTEKIGLRETEKLVKKILCKMGNESEDCGWTVLIRR